jgi:hypothetical protein
MNLVRIFFAVGAFYAYLVLRSAGFKVRGKRDGGLRHCRWEDFLATGETPPPALAQAISRYRSKLWIRILAVLLWSATFLALYLLFFRFIFTARLWFDSDDPEEIVAGLLIVLGATIVWIGFAILWLSEYIAVRYFFSKLPTESRSAQQSTAPQIPVSDTNVQSGERKLNRWALAYAVLFGLIWCAGVWMEYQEEHLIVWLVGELIVGALMSVGNFSHALGVDLEKLRGYWRVLAPLFVGYWILSLSVHPSSDWATHGRAYHALVWLLAFYIQFPSFRSNLILAGLWPRFPKPIV